MSEQRVFAKWQDGCWYAALLQKKHDDLRAKCKITWCDSETDEQLASDLVVNANEVLTKGIAIQVKLSDHWNYTPAFFSKFDKDGLAVCKTPKGSKHRIDFGKLLVEAQVMNIIKPNTLSTNGVHELQKCADVALSSSNSPSGKKSKTPQSKDKVASTEAVPRKNLNFSVIRVVPESAAIAQSAKTSLAKNKLTSDINTVDMKISTGVKGMLIKKSSVSESRRSSPRNKKSYVNSALVNAPVGTRKRLSRSPEGEQEGTVSRRMKILPATPIDLVDSKQIERCKRELSFSVSGGDGTSAAIPVSTKSKLEERAHAVDHKHDKRDSQPLEDLSPKNKSILSKEIRPKSQFAVSKQEVTTKINKSDIQMANRVFEGYSFVTSNNLRTPDKKLPSATTIGLIEYLGGTVYTAFDAFFAEPSEYKFLIAKSPLRTAKFFSALAVNIPCVSDLWIHKVAELGRLVDFETFRLAAGNTWPDEQLVVWKPRNKDSFKGKRVGLFGKSPLISEMSGILQLVQCNLILLENMEQIRQLEADCVKIVVVDASEHLRAFLGDLKNACNSVSITLVHSEWLFQSIVIGKRQPFEKFESFDCIKTADPAQLI